MTTVPYIPGTRVRELLDWDKTFEAVECALKGVSQNRVDQRRSVVGIGNTNNILLNMVGHISDEKYGALGCKLLVDFPNNRNLGKPSARVNIILLDEATGDIKTLMAGEHIVHWRTAAASAVATKYLHGQDNNVLAILGAGALGKAHAVAFRHILKFNEIRIWNRTTERARQLVSELNLEDNSNVYRVYDDIQECLRGANVIVTATSGNTTLVKREWLDKGVHINAVRVNVRNHELEDRVFQDAHVYFDSYDGAGNELNFFRNLGVELKGNIGDLIVGSISAPSRETITVFQSFGMAVEDCTMARMIYDLHNSQ